MELALTIIMDGLIYASWLFVTALGTRRDERRWQQKCHEYERRRFDAVGTGAVQREIHVSAVEDRPETGRGQKRAVPKRKCAVRNWLRNGVRVSDRHGAPMIKLISLFPLQINS